MRYSVLVEPRGGAYRRLLTIATEWCDRATLVVRDQLPLAESGAAVLRRLPVTATTRASRWPGTELHGSLATVHDFPLTPAAVEVLGTATDGLYGWTQPALPEDLCLLRPDGEPWLVVVAHERDAYVDLRDGERAALSARVSSLLLRADAGG